MRKSNKKSPEVENNEAVVETPVVSPKEENTPETPVEKPTKSSEISEDVDNILKLFNQYEKLYIGNHGEVYSVDTPQEIRQDAVLYNNKYFNN